MATERLVRTVHEWVHKAADAPGLRQAPGPTQTAPVAWPQIPGVDAAQAAQRLGGDLALWLKSLQRLLIEYADWAADDSDLPREEGARQHMAARLHKLRGIAGTLGITGMMEQAQALEAGLLQPTPAPELGAGWRSLQSALADVELTYQNLDSVELGVTTVDNYFDTLGGITQAVKRARGGVTPPVYIGDQTKGDGAVRSLKEQVALETRTRMLNPKWYEGMLESGYEGVRQIEVHVTNTMGWSATTGQVQPWVYEQLSQTFMLDPDMRNRLAKLNPTASMRVANRLLEASDRQYWQPDPEVLAALRQASTLSTSLGLPADAVYSFQTLWRLASSDLSR